MTVPVPTRTPLPTARQDPGRRDVILLDLDGTLIPDLGAFRAATAAVLDDHLGAGRDRDPVTEDSSAVDELLQRARDRWQNSALHQQGEALGVSSWEAMWSDLDHHDPTTPPAPTSYAVAVWHDMLAAAGADPAAAPAAAQRLITRREALVCPYPGALDTLASLMRGHRLWVVTHGSGALQRRKLHLAGLNQYIEQVWISSEIGHLKDDPAFAALVSVEAQTAGLIIHSVIGDSSSDMALARHGGWLPVHICPEPPCLMRTTSVHLRTFADCGELFTRT